MARQLNLRVDEAFAESLENLSKKMGRSMASVLETVGLPAIQSATNDLQFEADAFTAWEEYELTGEHVKPEEINSLFETTKGRAAEIAMKKHI